MVNIYMKWKIHCALTRDIQGYPQFVQEKWKTVKQME